MSKEGKRAKSSEGEAEGAGRGAGFDESLERLEAIVTALEKGGSSLEVSLERYREGVELLRTCRQTLESYRRQVEELTQGAEAQLRPYEGDPDLPAPGGAPRRASPGMPESERGGS